MIVTCNWQQKQIQLRQLVYIKQVLRKHGIWEYKPVIVLIDTQLSVTETGYKATNTF